MEEMKTYVITLSKTFPSAHPRRGQATLFRDRFGHEKIHTLRANYPLWEKRMEEVENGEARLSVRQWTGAPYRSRQEEIYRLTSEDGAGIQAMRLTRGLVEGIVEGRRYSYLDIARNDGLDAADWVDWFKAYDPARPLAVIHFTPFRY